MDLEKLATSAVVASISKTDTLEGFINTGDKEPCWDGNIYIYEDKRHTKKNIKRVSAQIKGKAVFRNQVEDIIKYRVCYDDLHAYMMNNGTMFFVVYLDKNTGDVLQIYYAPLLPSIIKEYLKDEQKSYKIRFRKFPSDPIKETEILLNFYNNSYKQSSFVGRSIPTLEELQEQGLLESLMFEPIGYGISVTENELPKIIDGQGLTLYANVKGSVIPIPIESYDFVEHVTTCRTIEEDVRAGGITFYRQYKKIVKADYIKILIGSCVYLQYENTGEPMNSGRSGIQIDVRGNLSERITGLRFILAILIENGFEIGNRRISLALKSDQPQNLNQVSINQFLDEYCEIQNLLNMMHVTKDLDIGACTKEDFQKISILLWTIQKKNTISSPMEFREGFNSIVISNLRLAIICIKREPNNYELYDYFSSPLSVTVKNESGKRENIPQFATMQLNDFTLYDNIDFDYIVEDYQRQVPSSTVAELGNNTLLLMLKAYDQHLIEDLLHAAQKLSEWEENCLQDFLPEYVIKLNKIQIVKRQRILSYDEKMILYNITAKAKDNLAHIGALLLLDECSKAKELIEALTPEQREYFQNFPIYWFYQKSLEDNNKNDLT